MTAARGGTQRLPNSYAWDTDGLRDDVWAAVVEAGVPFGWVTADEVYGSDTTSRLWLENPDIPHRRGPRRDRMRGIARSIGLGAWLSHRVAAGTPTANGGPVRSSTGAVPPPRGRGVSFGVNGSANTHNSSGTSRNDNRSTAAEDHGTTLTAT